MIQVNRKDNHKRKTMCLSLWSCKFINLFYSYTFKEPSDPTSYLGQELNMTNAIAYVKELNASQTEIHYTLTHLMGHAMAWGAWKMRRDIGRIRWGFFKHQKKVGITCLVDVEGGKDLVPCTFFNAHEMTLKEFA
jgi:hypothetical protein